MADEILEVDVDGVTVLWVPGDARELTGGITFRVGMSDEPFVWRGFSHLIEHLALSSLNVDYEYNGFVDSTTTNFIARGSTGDVLHFMETTLATLTDMPYERLDVERSRLVADSERNGVSSAANALAMLYGANGIGAVALPEMGLWRATTQTIEQWLSAWFTRDNMVLWFAGPEPERPSLTRVREGRRRPTVRIDRLRPGGPGYFYDSVSGPGLVSVVARSPLVAAGLDLVSDRMGARLRAVDSSVRVVSNARPLTSSMTMLTLMAETSTTEPDDVFSIMVTELNRFAFEGPTPSEIDTWLRGRREVVDDHTVVTSKASAAAYNRLQGTALTDPEHALGAVESASATDIADAVEDIARSAMWVVPPGTTVRDQRFLPVSAYTSAEVTGSVVRSRVGGGGLAVEDGRLVAVDNDGVLAFVAPVHELVGVAAYDDGAHRFFRRDAMSVTVRPTDFPGCEAGFREYLARIPDSMVVKVPRPSHTDEVGFGLQKM